MLRKIMNFVCVYGKGKPMFVSLNNFKTHAKP